MKKYILPILTAAILFTTSCNEDSTNEVIEETTTKVEESATKVKEVVNTNTIDINEDGSISPKKVTPAVVKDPTTLKVDRMTHDFGNIPDNASVNTKFVITNTGDKPLIITQAKGSCGCTVPVYPKEPIAPGATGDIEITFNPKGKAGKQNKTVTIIANTEPANTVINITSTVEKTEGAAPAPTK